MIALQNHFLYVASRPKTQHLICLTVIFQQVRFSKLQSSKTNVTVPCFDRAKILVLLNSVIRIVYPSKMINSSTNIQTIYNTCYCTTPVQRYEPTFTFVCMNCCRQTDELYWCPNTCIYKQISTTNYAICGDCYHFRNFGGMENHEHGPDFIVKKFCYSINAIS